MSESEPNQDPAEPKCRPAGCTEHSWCKAVPGGTGITVLALLLTKPPDIPRLQTALHKLQNTHPILRSRLHYNPTAKSFSFLTPATPHLQIQPFDLQSTAHILQSDTSAPSQFHAILEHEINRNTWSNPDDGGDTDLFFATLYTLEEEKWVVALRLHTGACDRTSAVSLLRKLLGLMGGGIEKGLGEELEVKLGIEDYIPTGKASKPFWARGVDMLGYSLNSFRLANLDFIDVETPRSSQVVRLKIESEYTDRILEGCKSRGIKLCGLLAAAALIATRSSKSLPDEQWEKYSVTTLIDSRPILDPILSSYHLGFYHSAIINTHDLKGGEKIWDLARRTYMAFANAKQNNKHFSDMADLNFLMCKAIDNPGMTPSSSLRTSVVSVFEDPVVDHSNRMHQEIGVEDYMGCASAHSVGPSIAIFDSIRDGELDCACVYPSPLHLRKQMQDLVEHMKKVLVDGCNVNEE